MNEPVTEPVTDLSENLIDVSGTTVYREPEPEIILLSDIFNSQSMIAQKESNDKVTLQSIGTISSEALKPKLLQWAMDGFRNAYPILEFTLNNPSICSDGQCRCLSEYIEFCSGKPIQGHVANLQARMPDIIVSFCNTGYSIQIVVSKA